MTLPMLKLANPGKLLAPTVYLLGMGGFLLNDILVARYFSTVDIAYWAEIKSFVLITSVVLLCGIDQVLVRKPTHSRYLMVMAACLLTIMASLGVGVLLWQQFAVDAYLVWAAIVLVAAGTLLHGIFRSHHQFAEAQLAKNGWRLVLPIATLMVILFAPNGRSILHALVISLGVMFVVTLLVHWGTLRHILSVHTERSPKPQKDLALGLKLLVSLLTLAVSLHLEQLLLNRSGYINASATYFSHAALIWPPLIVVSGYAGFLLGPHVQKNASGVVHGLRVWMWRLALGSALFLAATYMAVSLVFDVVVTDEIPFSPGLACLLLGIGTARAAYVFPSAFVGGLANERQLNVFVCCNVFGVLILVMGYYTGLKLGISPLYAVGLASLANWLIRITGGYVLMRTICRGL